MDETNKFMINQNIPSILALLNFTNFENGKVIAQKLCD